MCRRRDLKVSAGKNKMMVLNGEEGLECEILVDEIQLENVSEFWNSNRVYLVRIWCR